MKSCGPTACKRRVVGIDLGTTNSLVAHVEDGAPIVIGADDALVPSVVYYGGDGVVVGDGEDALAALIASDDWQSAPNTYWRDADGTCHQPRFHATTNIEQSGFADYRDLPLDRYFEQRTMVYADHKGARESLAISSRRGCIWRAQSGGCTFCSITEHEGRVIQNRSAESVLREIRALRRQGDFRGTITDLGGPTANMYRLACKSPEIESKCRRLSCVHPGVCENLKTDHGPLIQLMQRVRKEDGVKHVFIASGVRYDLAERSPEYVEELARHHVGGQLSVAPEHVSPRVLEKMKKPGIESYERFQQMFACASKDAGKEQYDIPYFISGHPGSTLQDMVELALWLKKNGRRPRQVQDFIPTPMAMATCMYHTGIDPLTMQPVYTATGLRAKKLQKSLLLYWSPEQWPLAREALREAGRADLIGSGSDALVPA